MAEGIGLLAGLMTVLLVSVLAIVFFRKCGMLSAATAALLFRSEALCLGFGILFFTFGLFLRFAAYGPEALCPPWEVFSSAGILWALSETSKGSALLFLPGHGMGLLFSGNFGAGGMTLSFLLSCLSFFLILKTLSRCLGEKAALRLGILLLSLPGAFLCFLPGTLPWAVLLVSLLTFFLFRKKHPIVLPQFLWESLLALSSILSAAVMYLFSTGAFL